VVLSEQQEKILEVSKKLKNQEILKINAFAGTGKTTTLTKITNSLIDKSFLYLAFNNDIVKEAKTRFRSNTFATTINSLAYKEIVTKKDYKLSKNNFSPLMISETLDLDYTDAFDILQIYLKFCNSNYGTIDKLKNEYIPRRIASFRYAEELFNKIKNKEIECDHSFYLKLYELEKYATLIKYDYVLLDEAQDTNPVTLSIFNQINSRKILVGDTHQTIYQFRGSINAMETVQSSYTKYLSTTYRCNQQVVNYANKVLQKYKQEKEKLISGIKNQDLTINETAYITRTNSEIINLIQKLEDFNCMKKIDDIFGLSIAIYLFIENKEIKKEKYQYLNKFKTINNLQEYADETNDINLIGAIRNAKMYKGYLYVLEKKAKNNHSNKSKNILITGHGSKGLEYDSVVVCKDFKEPSEYENYSEYICEANLLYVVITRAKKKIFFENKKIIDAIC
jgi:F-box protein, helicase, 18